MGNMAIVVDLNSLTWIKCEFSEGILKCKGRECFLKNLNSTHKGVIVGMARAYFTLKDST